MAAQQPVLIIGAGLSGLSLARVLKSYRIPSIVFDSVSPSSRYLDGINLWSWSYKPLLERLSIDGPTFRTSTAMDGRGGGSGQVDASHVRDARAGSQLRYESPLQNKAEDGFFRCRRKRLFTLLQEGLDIRHRYRLSGFEDSKTNKGCVTATFRNGEKVEGSMLVGADGPFSTVRRSILRTEPSIFPAVVISGSKVLPRSDLDETFLKYMDGSHVLLGASENARLSISIDAHSSTTCRVRWTYSRQPTEPQEDDPLYQPKRTRDEAANIPPEFWEELKALPPLIQPFNSTHNVDSAKNDKLRSWLMRSIRIPLEQLLDSVRGPQAKGEGQRKSQAPVVLIGDAAHGMPIFLGDGANHAIVDAVELGRLVDEARKRGDSFETAVRSFYKGAHQRWVDGIDTSEGRLRDFHGPMTGPSGLEKSGPTVGGRLRKYLGVSNS